MEPLSRETVRAQSTERKAREWASFRSFTLGALAFCLAGCVSTSSFLHWTEQKPYGEPCRVVAAWNPAVVSTPDPVHDGTPNPGLAGRIYLFGKEIGCPMLGNGSLYVALFDDSKCGDGKSPAPLEEWRFDAATLKQLEHRDPVGWGYTVFLPWATYKPEITRVHLKVRYEPPHAFPIYASSAPMTLVDPQKMDKWENSVARVVQPGNSVGQQSPGVTPASTQNSSPRAPRASP